MRGSEVDQAGFIPRQYGVLESYCPSLRLECLSRIVCCSGAVRLHDDLSFPALCILHCSMPTPLRPALLRLLPTLPTHASSVRHAPHAESAPACQHAVPLCQDNELAVLDERKDNGRRGGVGIRKTRAELKPSQAPGWLPLLLVSGSSDAASPSSCASLLWTLLDYSILQNAVHIAESSHTRTKRGLGHAGGTDTEPLFAL